MQLIVASFIDGKVMKMSVGERIVDLRKERNISQGQLAALMDVTRQAVSKWENDLSSPDTLNLIRLADVLDTDVEYLATGRKSYGRRPPVVVETIKTVEKVVEKPVYIEKVIEKPVVQYVQKPVTQYVEKPVIKKVERIRYMRNPVEFFILAIVSLLIGMLIGYFLPH